MTVAGCLVAYYHFVYLPAHAPPSEYAYSLDKSVEVMDSPAEVRTSIATLKSEERVGVLVRTRSWLKVRLEGGQVGWVETKYMLDAITYEGGRRLFESLQRTSVQAVGHVVSQVRLRLGPGREASQIGQLGAEAKVEIFDRRLVALSSGPAGAATASAEEYAAQGPARREAWYLVRSGSKAGWVLGRLVDLDIPESIAAYAQETNMVAWLVLNTVDDNGEKLPQYLVADRIGTQQSDFNHIRVLTWWAKAHHYVIAYVESNLKGYFPIRVAQVDGKPVFRLRLLDVRGNKFQKVYELSDTITRPRGNVEGWESNALPAPRAAGRRGSRGRRKPGR